MKFLEYAIALTILGGLGLTAYLIYRNIKFNKLRFYYEYRSGDCMDDFETLDGCDTLLILPIVHKESKER